MNKFIQCDNILQLTSILFLICFLFLSCASQRFYLAQDVEKPGRVPNFENYQHYFVFGLFQNQDLNLTDACKGNKISYIETQYNFLSVLAFVVTYGIFVPKKVNVYCEIIK